MELLLASLFVLLLNIPFGYWRANTEKFSLQWILSIHVPVPVVVAVRIFCGLGWHFITFPALIGAFFAGQFLGGGLHSRLLLDGRLRVTSCLIHDVFRFAIGQRQRN